MAKRGLGRGIDALLPELNMGSLVGGLQVIDLDISSVKPNPSQPRQLFPAEAMAELAHSIEAHGILQPLIVVKDGAGYTLVAGERRWRAAKEAGLSAVPCIVRTYGDIDHLHMSLVENMQRQDLNVMEEAHSIARLKDDFNQSYEQISASLGKPYSYIAGLARLVRLPAEIQASVASGDISQGMAKVLLSLSKSPVDQARLHSLVLEHGWTVRRAEEFVFSAKKGKKEEGDVKRSTGFVTNEWTKGLAKRFETKIQIQRKAKGSGYIKIDYQDEQDLERIKNLLEN